MITGRAFKFGDNISTDHIIPGRFVHLRSNLPELARHVLEDIADEERVHAGEFLRLLRELAPDEEKFYAEGAEEVDEMIKKRD